MNFILCEHDVTPTGHHTLTLSLGSAIHYPYLVLRCTI